jgi:hypothetical protein
MVRCAIAIARARARFGIRPKGLSATDRMFDTTWLLLSLIPGGIRFVLFVFG